MPLGSGNSPIEQQIILALEQTGNVEAVLAQLMRAQTILEALTKLSQDNTRADKDLEKATYDVGAAYELMAEKIGRATTAAEKNVQAAPWASRQQQAVSDLIREMGAYEARSDALTATELRNYQVIAAAATRTGAAVADANQRTTMTSQAASRAVLEFSRGVEDLATGGFLGILNNIPGVVYGIGQAMSLSATQTAGLTAGVSLLATAAFEVYMNYDKLQTAFGIGIPRPILDTTEELKDKLTEASKVTGELGKKTNLTLTEVREYREATQHVKEFNAELARRKQLEDILSGKSKAERERASAFKEAVAESGGNVALDSLDTAIGGHAVGGKVFNEFTGKNSTPRELAERMIGAAGEGDKRIRDQIVELLNIAYKPTESSFASNIVATSPETVAAKKAAEEAQLEQMKIDDKLKKDADDALGRKIRQENQAEQASIDNAQENARKANQAREKLVNANVRRVGPGFGDQWEAALFEHAEAGGDMRGPIAQGRPELVGRLKQRGVPEGVVGEVADAIIQKAAERAENLIASGGTPKAIRAEGTAAAKTQTAYQKAVGKADDGYLKPLEMAITQNRMGQLEGNPAAVPEAVLAGRMESVVARNLRGAGQDPGLAKGIVQSAIDEFGEKYTAMFAATGSREQALIGVNQGLMAALAQEQAAGERRDQQITQLQMGARGINQQARRNQQQRPTNNVH